tara:strand:- start:1772 stop:2632 length:861 start_codon:yes stop_codon:yes gene_type:complete
MSFADTGDTQFAKGQKIEFYNIPNGLSVSFKAFVTEFNDVFTSNWESEEVYGRMDPIQTFKSTKREITLGFDIVAGSENEAISNLSKMSTLISFLYPNYDGNGTPIGEQIASHSIGANTISSAPLMKVKFMNLISRSHVGGNAQTHGLVCTCNGFSFTPDIESGWVMNKAGTEALYPKLYNVSMTLTVLHDHSLGWTPNGPAKSQYPYGVVTAADFDRTMKEVNETIDNLFGGSSHDFGDLGRSDITSPPAGDIPPAQGDPGRANPNDNLGKARQRDILKNPSAIG